MPHFKGGGLYFYWQAPSLISFWVRSETTLIKSTKDYSRDLNGEKRLFSHLGKHSERVGAGGEGEDDVLNVEQRVLAYGIWIV